MPVELEASRGVANGEKIKHKSKLLLFSSTLSVYRFSKFCLHVFRITIFCLFSCLAINRHLCWKTIGFLNCKILFFYYPNYSIHNKCPIVCTVGNEQYNTLTTEIQNSLLINKSFR